MRMSFSIFLGASVLVHGGLLLAFAVPDNTLVAAGPPPAMVAQGNSFSDMIEGAETSTPETVTPTQVEDITKPPSQTPETVRPANVADLAAQATPTETESPDTPQAAANVQLDADALQSAPADIFATAVVPQSAAIEPVTAVAVSTIQPTAAARPTPEVVEALPDVQVNEVSAGTVRPPTRPADLGQAPPPRPTPIRQAQTAPQGNSTANTRRGATTPTPTSGKQAQQGQGSQVDQAAIAAAQQAAAGYDNAVMRKISRTRRENTRSRGVAVVSFRVGSRGELAAVSIAQSSDDAGLDSVAVNHIRRAAPFPTPPAGARTSFSIRFQGR
jgi:protein TonB